MTPQGEALLLRLSLAILAHDDNVPGDTVDFWERRVAQHLDWLEAQNEPLNQPDPSPGLTDPPEEE